MHVVEAEDVHQLVDDDGDLRAGAAGNIHNSDLSKAGGGITSVFRLSDLNVRLVGGCREHFFKLNAGHILQNIDCR